MINCQQLLEKLKNELIEMKYPQKIDDFLNGDYVHIIRILHFSFYSYSKNINKYLESQNYQKKLKYKDKEFIELALEILSELFNYTPKLNSNQIFSSLFVEEKLKFCFEVVKIIKLAHNEINRENESSYKKIDKSDKINNISKEQTNKNESPNKIESYDLYSLILGLSQQVDFLSNSFQNFQVSIDTRISKIEDDLISSKKINQISSNLANNEIDNGNGYVFSFADDHEICVNKTKSSTINNNSTFKNEKKFPITLKKDNRDIHTKNADELIDRVSNKFKETQKLLNEMNK